jgi:hypothetical protein
MIHTMAEIKARSRALNKRKGLKPGAWWFSPGNLRFFSSRVSSVVFPVPTGAYFITSEQFESVYLPSKGEWTDPEPRLWTLRFCADSGEIDTCGDFQAYDSLRDAQRAAKFLQTSNV